MAEFLMSRAESFGVWWDAVERTRGIVRVAA